jgi:hypothetical protein
LEKLSQERADGVVQGVGPEFKPQKQTNRKPNWAWSQARLGKNIRLYLKKHKGWGHAQVVGVPA